jgi:hypothetical protein
VIGEPTPERFEIGKLVPTPYTLVLPFMPHVTSTQEQYDLGIHTYFNQLWSPVCLVFESGRRYSEDKSVHLHSHVAY